MNIPRKKRKILKVLFLTLFAILIATIFYQLHQSTGIFQPSKIDSRDIDSWDRTGEFITGSEGFTYAGKKDTCWLLIHSYAASPAEMRGLADKIYENFGDTIVGVRLHGHGELPSRLEDKNLDSWYPQVEAELEEGLKSCNSLNVVGSSLGAVLALRLAEDYNLKNVYLVNPFITKSFSWYKILPFELRLRLFSQIYRYDKKTKIANINDPFGLQQHIAYWNLPYTPLRTSLQFIGETRDRLSEITEPILIAHSRTDSVASPFGVNEIYSTVQSKEKEILWLSRSNHVLLMDYDREEVISSIILFEERFR